MRPAYRFGVSRDFLDHHRLLPRPVPDEIEGHLAHRCVRNKFLRVAPNQVRTWIDWQRGQDQNRLALLRPSRRLRPGRLQSRNRQGLRSQPAALAGSDRRVAFLAITSMKRSSWGKIEFGPGVSEITKAPWFSLSR